MKGDNLTVKQKAFADFYIESVNASASYKRAGYQCANDQVAEVGGSRLLSNTKVREYVDERMNSIADDRIMTAQEILARLTSIGRGEVETDVKDQIKAMELVLKRYPQYSEQIKDDKVLAETEFIKERTKLLKGVTKDTSLLESLIKAVGP
jgi:phage terminase small subunit